MVSVAIHAALFVLLLSFASGSAPAHVQPVTEIGIEAFLVSGMPAAAGKSAVLPGSKPREPGEVAPALTAPAPAREVQEPIAPTEKEGIKPLAEIRPSAEGSGMRQDAGTLPAPMVLISGSGGPPGDDGDPALRREGTGTPHEGGGIGSAAVADAIARYMDRTLPAYPPLARLRRHQGEALLSVEVLADGRVGRVAISRSTGHEILDRTALAAVRSWRFIPGRRGGHAVATSVDVPFRFVLTGNSALVRADDQW